MTVLEYEYIYKTCRILDFRSAYKGIFFQDIAPKVSPRSKGYKLFQRKYLEFFRYIQRSYWNGISGITENLKIN